VTDKKAIFPLFATIAIMNNSILIMYLEEILYEYLHEISFHYNFRRNL